MWIIICCVDIEFLVGVMESSRQWLYFFFYYKYLESRKQRLQRDPVQTLHVEGKMRECLILVKDVQGTVAFAWSLSTDACLEPMSLGDLKQAKSSLLEHSIWRTLLKVPSGPTPHAPDG